MLKLGAKVRPDPFSFHYIAPEQSDRILAIAAIEVLPSFKAVVLKRWSGQFNWSTELEKLSKIGRPSSVNREISIMRRIDNLASKNDLA